MFTKINIGTRLRKKEHFTEVFTKAGHVFGIFIKIDIVKGVINKTSEKIKDELNISIWFITFTWSCTRSVWLLKPMDHYYPLKAKKTKDFNFRVR